MCGSGCSHLSQWVVPEPHVLPISPVCVDVVLSAAERWRGKEVFHLLCVRICLNEQTVHSSRLRSSGNEACWSSM